jgi:hypothetical protein
MEVEPVVKVVGAGVGRTGTHSLKLALEQLLGGPCYHMAEVFEHLDHVPTWTAALRGEQVDWEPVLGSYSAVVDWPGAGCWDTLARAYPDALVLLSTRRDPEQWWTSADATIFRGMGDGGPPNPAMDGWREMAATMMDKFDPNWSDHDAAIAAYERHNAFVRNSVPAERLVEWQPGDGWAPLCSALGLPLPDAPFPHSNTTEEFLARIQSMRASTAASG